MDEWNKISTCADPWYCWARILVIFFKGEEAYIRIFLEDRFRIRPEQNYRIQNLLKMILWEDLVLNLHFKSQSQRRNFCNFWIFKFLSPRKKNKKTLLCNQFTRQANIVVAVYIVTIVASRHWWYERFWPMVIDCVLWNIGSFLY